ncbi:24125_t:CDS:2, partial [Gigaspora margarita]
AKNPYILNNNFEEILQIFNCDSSTLYLTKKFLQSLVNIDMLFVDMCINSCIAFTGEYSEAIQCPICLSERFQKTNVAYKVAAYYPLTSRFKFQYANSKQSKTLRYRSNYISSSDKISDIFDGQLYKSLLSKEIIKDERDIILTGSLDGYQIFRQQRDNNWVVMFINNNIPLEDRVKQENLLISAIIPGPKSPKDFNSFIFPIISELKILEENFILRVFAPIWCGDIPAISKLINVTGHNGYMGCRFCDIKGVSDSDSGINHVYYPLKHPTKKSEKSYNTKNLPLRNHESYLEKVLTWKMASDKKKAQRETDIMHLVFEGAAMHMYKHWSGTFYSNKSLNNSEINPQTLSKAIWRNIGNIMEENKKAMPSEFGRPPLDIAKYSNAYKAEDWINWTCLYSIPLLQLFHDKRLYVDDDIKRLPAFRITFHYLLHIQACIENCGPCWVYWQFPIERLCGMLQPMIQSNQHPYKNLMNNILLLDYFNYLRFVPTIYRHIFPLQQQKQYQIQQVVWIEDGGEELWAPSLDYTLNDKEFIALAKFYQANLNQPITELCDWGIKYAKLRTRDGYMLSSLMSAPRVNARENSCVIYELEVNISKSKALEKYELRQFFGQVQFYFYYVFDKKYQLLAYIRNVKNVQKGLYGLYNFEEFGDYEFVDVSMIRRC